MSRVKTVLCVPGHDEKKVEGCRRWGADLILFDLEDSVPAEQKDKAREIVRDAVQPGDAIRINAGGWSVNKSDIEMVNSLVLPEALHSVWLPKMRRWSLEEFIGLSIRTPIVPIIETPELVMRLPELFHQVYRRNVRGLAFGVADFCFRARCTPDSSLAQDARRQVSLMASALGVESYDAPDILGGSPNATADEAWREGFTHKGVLRPRDIVEIQHAFNDHPCSVSRHEAREALRQHEASGAQVSQHRGLIVAPPTIPILRRIAGIEEEE